MVAAEHVRVRLVSLDDTLEHAATFAPGDPQNLGRVPGAGHTLAE
jgi:hypothetical protein